MKLRSKRLSGTILLLAFLCFPANSNPIRVLNTVEFDFPDSFEGYSPSITFSFHKATKKYLVSYSIPFVYRHSYLILSIDLYGQGQVEGVTTALGKEPADRYNEYNMADQIKDLRRLFDQSPQVSKGGIPFSRFFSEWGTDWSSDYLGYYYRLRSNSFQECFISIYNSWSSLDSTVSLTLDQTLNAQRIKTQDSYLQAFYSLADQIAASFSKVGDTAGPTEIPSFLRIPKIRRPGVYLTTIDNLRWRAEPRATSLVYGVVPKRPIQILEVGESATFDGIKGNWVRISTRNRTGWAFDGYLRRMTDEEIAAREE